MNDHKPQGAEPHDPLVALADDPVGNTVHHPYSAFNQGWDAAEAGHSASLNPYDEGSRERHWWALGHAEYDEGDGPFRLPPMPPSALAHTRRARVRP